MRKYLAILIMIGVITGQSGEDRTGTYISAFYKSWLNFTGTSHDSILIAVTRIQDGAGYYAPFSLGQDSLVIHGYTQINKNLVAENAAGPAILDEGATLSNPTLVPNQADNNTGIGSQGDQLGIISAGSRVFDMDNNGSGTLLSMVSSSSLWLSYDEYPDASTEFRARKVFAYSTRSDAGEQEIDIPADRVELVGQLGFIIDCDGNAAWNNITVIADGGGKTINGAGSVKLNTDYGWMLTISFNDSVFATGSL